MKSIPRQVKLYQKSKNNFLKERIRRINNELENKKSTFIKSQDAIFSEKGINKIFYYHKRLSSFLKR